MTRGNVFLLVIDTNKPFAPGRGKETPISSWIRKRLDSREARQATWRIAVGHEPGYSECWTPGKCKEYDGTPAVRDWLLPLLAKNGFHAYLAGHTHAYERAEVDGMLQIITGGGGSKLDQHCRELPVNRKTRIAYHYLMVDAGEETLTMEAHGLTPGAKPFDRVEIRSAPTR